MTTISINGRFLTQPITGVQRYGYEIVRTLDLLLTNGTIASEGIKVELLAPRAATSVIQLHKIKFRPVGCLSGHLWEQSELPVYCRGTLLFTPCGGAPIIHDEHVITLADAAIFAAAKGYSRKYSKWYRWFYRRVVKKAQHVLTVSEFSRRELQKWCAIPPEKLTAIPLAGGHILRIPPDQSILEKHNLTKRPFVLAVSSMNPNKNLRGIAEAIRLLPAQQLTFALAGGVNSNVFGRHAPLPSNVVRLGFVTDAQLRALYEKALCFVFPSFYEGFGIPPMEAMVCGCPAIVSRAASLPEVYEDSALYCDPSNPADIAQKIRQITEDSAMRLQFIEKGARRATCFSWERTTQGVWDILRRVIGALRS